MIGLAASRALRDLFSPPFRAAFWKSLGLTALVLVGLWFAVEALFERVAAPWAAGWLPALPAWASDAERAAGWLAGLLLAIALAFLIGPVSAAIAGLFLDDVAEVVERECYPEAPPGRELPLAASLRLSAKFLGVIVLGNLLAFALLLVPVVNLVAFFAVNSYLLGREYFEFAAMRYRTEHDAKALRRRHRGTVLAGGAVVACFLAVPVVNLLTPLVAAALMVNLHQLVSRREGGLPAPPVERRIAAAGPRSD
ncbi:sulfate transporter family protein [Aureimonas leprariae]|uniref:Sulfate transporter family protein n=1 Tax=Plantimonas leprariae TaxID=2615207 RepID=A0A7V7PL05_9HYPH|nr:sulfate transporter family protein [Aureimonas leprariae]KAB0676805.1 sulfate transporter family protein [Aureimonas leprariae]